MKMPNVKNQVIDTKSNVTYVVLAYRTLSEGETRTAIAYYRSQTKKKPKAGTTVTIVSTIE